MITLTDKAKTRLREFAESEGFTTSVRVKIVGGGCAGFSYDMTFEDASTEVDEVFEDDGIKVIVDPLSLQYLENTVIDYQDGTFGSGFKFLNPNTTGSCGCGSSVSF